MYHLEPKKHVYGHKTKVSGQCPHCLRHCLFAEVGVPEQSQQQFAYQDGSLVYASFGIRTCPDCFHAIFFVSRFKQTRGGSSDEEVIRIFPPMAPQIEAEGYPDLITKLLTEAIQCFHAECYRASAIMIRRTLEELCSELGAQGGTLHAKLLDLPNQTPVPADLLQGLMDLKLLGNDAAHIELKNFDQIEREEVDVALDLTQEILRAWFKRNHLAAKLAHLKKKTNPAV